MTGFPRSLDQAESLHNKNPPDVAIQLDVPFTTIIDRIKSRWIHLPSGRVYNLEFNAPKIAVGFRSPFFTLLVVGPSVL